MIKKLIRWLIFGSSILELQPKTKWQYSVRKGKPYKELIVSNIYKEDNYE